MKPREYINASFEQWWSENQGDRMPKSKYLARKAWMAAYKNSWPLFTKIQSKLAEKYDKFLFS